MGTIPRGSFYENRTYSMLQVEMGNISTEGERGGKGDRGGFPSLRVLLL